MIFFDCNIPACIPQALRLLEKPALCHKDYFPHDTKDSEWLACAGHEGWSVVTRDRNISLHPGEVEAVITHNVGCFIFSQKRYSLKKWGLFKLIVSILDQIEEKFRATSRPFIYLIGPDGKFKEVDLEKARSLHYRPVAAADPEVAATDEVRRPL